MNEVRKLKKMSNTIYSYMEVTVPSVGLPSIKAIEVREGISIPANAEQMPYGESFNLPVGKYNVYHRPDCAWFTKL